MGSVSSVQDCGKVTTTLVGTPSTVGGGSVSMFREDVDSPRPTTPPVNFTRRSAASGAGASSKTVTLQ